MEFFLFALCFMGGPALFWVLGHLAEKRAATLMENYSMPEPDGNVDNLNIFKFFGCGRYFSGHFRKQWYDDRDTYVSYLIFHLYFIPIIPIRAYRIAEDEDSAYVLGTEKTHAMELLSLYLKRFAFIPVLLSLILIAVLAHTPK